MAYRLTLEPILFLVFMELSLRTSLSTNLIIYRSCYLLLGYNKSECSQLGNEANNVTEELEKKVEPTANVIQMVQSLSISISAVLICLFIGAWSSRFGRKPALLICISGMIIATFMDTIFSYFENVSPWYFIFSQLPLMICGGFCSYITIIYAYISDITTKEDRSLRMALCELFGVLGMVSGTFISTYLFYATNYTTVYALATSCHIISLIYIIFFVKESIKEVETKGKLKSFFDVSNVKVMIKTSVKKRLHHDRLLIALLAITTSTYMFSDVGENSVSFLYLRQKLNWTLTKYNTFKGVQQVTNALGILVATYIFQKLLRLREVVTVIIVLISRSVGSTVTGFASEDWHIYLAAFIICFGGIVNPLTTSVISKLVPHEEIGSILSAFMALRFAVLMGASATFGLVYNKTIDINSGIYNFVSAGIYIIAIFLMLTVTIIESSPKPKTTAEGTEDDKSKETGRISIKDL